MLRSTQSIFISPEGARAMSFIWLIATLLIIYRVLTVPFILTRLKIYYKDKICPLMNEFFLFLLFFLNIKLYATAQSDVLLRVT